MGIVLIALTIVAAIVMIAGAIWMLLTRGTTTRRSGPEVGAEIMAGADLDQEGAGVTLLDKAAFAGKGVAVEHEASISYAEIKRLWREGNRQEVLPPALAMAGLYCFCVFGALALWVAMDDKLIASVIAAIVLVTMARIARDFIRA